MLQLLLLLAVLPTLVAHSTRIAEGLWPCNPRHHTFELCPPTASEHPYKGLPYRDFWTWTLSPVNATSMHTIRFLALHGEQLHGQNSNSVGLYKTWTDSLSSQKHSDDVVPSCTS